MEIARVLKTIMTGIWRLSNLRYVSGLLLITEMLMLFFFFFIFFICRHSYLRSYEYVTDTICFITGCYKKTARLFHIRN
jgi:hypothetical protein